MKELIQQGTIKKKIYLLRGQKVMLDRDLADIYGVKLTTLHRAVKKNKTRFPEDFLFRLTRDEAKTLKAKYAFTELGTFMLAGILRGKRALQVSLTIMRTVKFF